jgi:hypothetical protein
MLLDPPCTALMNYDTLNFNSSPFRLHVPRARRN